MVSDSSYNLVEIERQDRGSGKGLYILEDNDENYQFLLSLGKYEFEGESSWNIEDSASSIRIVTSWLNKHSEEIINSVKEYPKEQNNPDYIKCALIVEIYRAILNGEIHKSNDINISLFLKSDSNVKINNSTGHCEKWNELLGKIIYQNNGAVNNINLIKNYYNLIQGNKMASTYVIDYLRLNDVFKELKS